MIKNYSAVRTLIRNKLNDNQTIDKRIHWFHEKGVSIKIDDTNLYTLKKETDGHHSELTEICQVGLIYRGLKLICFMGSVLHEVKFSDLQIHKGITLSEKSIYIEAIEGRDIFMYHDPQINNWAFSDLNKTISSYKDFMLKRLYNIMNVDPAFTYHFKLLEKGSEAGIYLWAMYDTTKGIEMDYLYVDKHARRLKVLRPKIYKFEGIDNLEEKDLPIIAQDHLMRKIKIIA